MTTPWKIRIRGLRKEFATRRRVITALDGVDLEVAEGEFVCLVGPSGCGKTTLLRILAGLETPTAGTIEVARRDPSRPLQAMVFQEQSVFPWMTVRRNIGYGLALRRVPRAERERIVDRYLKLVGLEPFADAYPHQLSGGMKQRVSVARAFAVDPEILLMDEPFAALDEQNKLLLAEELLRLWESNRKTVLYVTHSIDEAIHLADRIVVFTASPGRIKAEVPVTIPRHRDLDSLRAHPAYAAIYQRVWQALRDEVLAARRHEERERVAGRR
ncbi:MULTISPECIES: ABC transporter ATP-binding protein [Thermaerobacter]|uniref:ABC transporter ATP-binding protein n=1 Tax=Thermaerobacter composti TaxID=554949 RepID=A0ABZ0QPU7_9FIRM|nr:MULTISPECIES: ABC transporter ATP-binding protein [Thermaerobacter]PZN06898.1 MAG: mannosyltransferase [Bacillota bacterium]QBS37461.1 ABC transporter ATP-binding protein [Thermaerobacter sp. FW80]WPD19514.1 ABC transporter ATP-binding protein [Thermaerobacter composti]